MWTIVVNCPRFPWLLFGPRRRGPQNTQGVSMLDKHLAGSSLFPGFVPHRDPVWAAGGDCASGSMVWPCVSHPPLSSHQTEGCIMAIVLSHLDDASSPQSLTVTCLSDNYHQNQLSYPPGSKGPCAGDWQAANFASSTAVMLCHLFHCSVYVFSLLFFHYGVLTVRSFTHRDTQMHVASLCK